MAIFFNYELLRSFPNALIPIIENSLILGDDLIFRRMLRTLREIAQNYFLPDLALKYVEYYLPRVKPKKGLKLIRWALKFIKPFYGDDWEITLIRAKLFLIASKVFLKQGYYIRAQHYAFSCVNELFPYSKEPITYLLKADAFNILAEIFLKRRFLRFSKRYINKAMAYLDKWLSKAEGVGWTKYAMRLFIQSFNIAMRKIEVTLDSLSYRAKKRHMDRIIRSLRILGEQGFMWRYLDLDVLKELRKTVYDLEWNRHLPEIYRPKLRAYRIELDKAISRIKYRDKFFLYFFRSELIKSVYLVDLGNPEEAFKILKKLFVFSKYLMGNWNYLLVAKYNMFKILYRYKLEKDLMGYLSATDVEQYITSDEAEVPSNIKLLTLKSPLGTDGVKLQPLYKLSSFKKLRDKAYLRKLLRLKTSKRAKEIIIF